MSELFRGTDSCLLNGFLKQYLPTASYYRRAVGFFASSVFGAAPEEFFNFFSRGGRMEIICSPLFSKSDINILHKSIFPLKTPRKLFTNILGFNRSIFSERLFEWAITSGHLSIRIATLHNQDQVAIYHEKIGIFQQNSGDVIAFEGSANESHSGYTSSYERIIVHHGSLGESTHWTSQIVRDFEGLWNNTTLGLRVVPLHSAFKKNLLKIRPEINQFSTHTDSENQISKDMTVPVEILKKPSRLELRTYQKKAISNWFAEGGRGVFSMATGSGKTITALATVEQLFQQVGTPLVIIIVAPYLNLVDQWLAEAQDFGLDPINCSGSSSNWTSMADMALFLNKNNERPILSLITTNATFSGKPFQCFLSKITVCTVLIADEVHNLGARHLRRSLPERIQLRLGLSATPERWMDEEGTSAISEYFGDVVFNYSLEDALKGNPPALSPYVYHPILVYLDDDEKEDYLEITKMLARYMNDPGSENLSDAALGLLLKRARIIACARGKIDALRKCIHPFRNSFYNLVYCGDGRVEIEAASDQVVREISENSVLRQVDAVTQILGKEFGMNVAKYTHETSLSDRRRILQEFEGAKKQALVAIRCLDEGVDVPKVRRAFILASSTNPRQFIQRRGRVLRRAEGKDRAEIYDFIVVPPINDLDIKSSEFRVLRNLVTKEMARVTEFARLAENGPQAIGVLRPILKELKLLHLC